MGLNGGAIFHKMMVKHGVKHICMTDYPTLLHGLYQTTNL